MLLKFHFFKPQLKASTILKKFQSQKHIFCIKDNLLKFKHFLYIFSLKWLFIYCHKLSFNKTYSMQEIKRSYLNND